MNKLSVEKRAQILSMLVQGSSMRTICGITGASINTISKLLVDAGNACAKYHDENVWGVMASKVQCDEIWSFCYAQQNVESANAAPEEAADVWTWTALDTDSKLIISYAVGGRDLGYALEFMDDAAKRLAHRAQVTVDGNKVYLEVIEDAIGSNVDYAQLTRLYGAAPESFKGRYSPAHCTDAIKKPPVGNPDFKHIPTSHIEHQHLTMRMPMRRFTRLTNVFNKKLDNYIHMLSLYFTHYNFCRIHKTLKITPATEAGLSDAAHTTEWIVGLIDAEAKLAKRGPYKKKNSN